jgi:NADPH-dependent 2,4-dienoyl-CoA reductase/sulfur reductase-like enzyme
MPRRIIVAGGLASGPAAASKAKRIDPDADVILLEKSGFISYGICELPYYISNLINNYNDLLVYTPEKLQSEKKISVKLFHELKEIDHRNKEILVYNSGLNELCRFEYDKLILSLGSIPLKTVTLPDASNIFCFKFLDDGIKLKSYLNYNKVKNVAIYGPGFIGLELAESLSNLGIKVTLFGKDDLPIEYFENESRVKILDLINEHDIEYINYSQIDSYKTNENRIDSVEIDRKYYKTDIIINAIGVIPNTALLKGSGIILGKTNGVTVDQKMQTNMSGIYACGDCCEISNKITMKKGLYPFANLANKTGWIAGENAAGGTKLFKGIIPAYTLKLFDTEFAHVGLTFKQAVSAGLNVERVSTTGLNKPGIIPDSKRITVMMTFIKDTKKLVGAELFGPEGCSLRANILSAAISAKMNLNDISDFDLVYQPLLTPLRDPIQYCAGLGLK